MKKTRCITAIIIMFSSTSLASEEHKQPSYKYNFLEESELALITDEDAKFIASTVMSEGTILTVRNVSNGSENVSVFDFIVKFKKKIWGCRSVLVADGAKVNSTSTRCKQN